MANMTGKKAYNARPEVCHPKVCWDDYESPRQKRLRNISKRSQKRKEERQWRTEEH